MIIEAHGGGMSSSLRSAINWMAKAGASLGNDSQASLSLRIAQRISCSLQRENARAVLRRMVVDEPVGESGQVVAEQLDAEAMDVDPAPNWQ